MPRRFCSFPSGLHAAASAQRHADFWAKPDGHANRFFERGIKHPWAPAKKLRHSERRPRLSCLPAPEIVVTHFHCAPRTKMEVRIEQRRATAGALAPLLGCAVSGRAVSGRAVAGGYGGRDHGQGAAPL